MIVAAIAGGITTHCMLPEAAEIATIRDDDTEKDLCKSPREKGAKEKGFLAKAKERVKVIANGEVRMHVCTFETRSNFLLYIDTMLFDLLHR